MTAAIPRLTRAVFKPQIRLDPDFPLTGFKMGKAYAVATGLFITGSLLPALLFLGFVLYVANHVQPERAMRILSPILDKNGGFAELTYLLLVLTTFVCGFTAELWYLRRALHLTGTRVRDAVGLSPGPLRGQNRWQTAWALLWRAGLAYVLWTCFEQAVSHAFNPPEQPTVEMMQQFHGRLLIVWMAMAALLAPFFEELVFRGFLFQALRSTFHKWHNEALAAGGTRRAMHVSVAHWCGQHLFRTDGIVDASAICLSAACFSLEHMQFQPMTMLMLFLMGALLAELFRRTGTLWTSILLHAANNFVAVFMLMHVH